MASGWYSKLSEKQKEASRLRHREWYANLSQDKKEEYKRKVNERKKQRETGETLEKGKAQRKSYYEAHKAELSAKSKIYREKHKEELRAKHREYYRKTRDLINMSLAIQLKAAQEEIESLKKELEEFRSKESGITA